MRIHSIGLCPLLAMLALTVADAPTVLAQGTTAITYAPDGRLQFPKDYRNWVYLSSGMNMSYAADAATRPNRFENVFVNPEAHRAFLKDGKWPDKTIFLLEIRAAEQDASINKSGFFQAAVGNREAHVKDSRLKGGWGFFAFEGEAPARLIPQTADCYSCHEAHGAADTTFVQFYPTLLPLAAEKKTLSAGYLADEAAAKSGTHP
jgi:cytochrome P460